MLRFEPALVQGAWLIDLSSVQDERGFFARVWCQREFEQHGLVADLVQMNLSHSGQRGTLRGLHYQVAPSEETKVISCIRGAIWDVIVDLRPSSSTYLRWIGVELTAGNRRQLYVPRGCAHGYQTLADETEVLYHASARYAPQAERGIRWNDPQFSIAWPIVEPIVSAKDLKWSDFEPDPGGEVREERQHNDHC
ncbi:MAG: dTDP-4-dehydrorhamnose 3,5-epimerase [Vicinamibacterales bacterium]